MLLASKSGERIIGSGFIGIGTALFCVEGARPFRAAGYRKVLCLGVFAMLGGSLLAYLITLMPPAYIAPLLAILPLPMVYCQRRSFRYYPRSELYVAEPKLPRFIPKGFLMVSLLHGIAVGGMFALLRSLEQPPVFHIHLLAFLAAISLLLLTAFFNKMNFNHLIFRLGFPVIASGYFVISLISEYLLIGNFLLYMGYCYLYLIICCLCAYLARVHRQSAVWIVGLCTGCLLTGQLLGEFIGSIFSGSHAVQFAAIMTFVFLLLALVLSGTDIAYGWGSVRPGADELLSAAIGSACEQMVEDFRLSRREKDVLLLLVRGRTRRYISERLDVTEETVKSHTGRIYAKLAVHSHAELMNLVEGRAHGRGK